MVVLLKEHMYIVVEQPLLIPEAECKAYNSLEIMSAGMPRRLELLEPHTDCSVLVAARLAQVTAQITGATATGRDALLLKQPDDVRARA